MKGALAEDVARRFGDEEATTTHDGWPMARISSNRWLDACRYLRDEELDFLASLTGVHYIDDGCLELVAHVYSIGSSQPIDRRRIVLKTRLDDKPGVAVPSVAEVWPTAEWHEREVWDMFGIRFTDHPDLRRILMEEEYDDHPLRKDFKDRKPNLGVGQEALQKDAASNR